MSSLKISVLLPVYHRDSPEALDSALRSIGPAQTRPPDEMVIVEDGPLPPSLRAVIESFSRQVSFPVSILRLPENRGLARALNLGLRACRHPWVARMDADDLALPERLARQEEFLLAHPEVDVLGALTADFLDDPAKPTGVRWVPAAPEEVARFARKRCPLNHQTVLMRRERILELGGYPEEVGTLEDYALWAKCLVKGLKLANLTEVLVLVRARGIAKRRGGWNYARNEWRLFRYFRRLGFHSRRDFLLIGVPRVLFRFLPTGVRRTVYRRFLRVRTEGLTTLAEDYGRAG